MKFFSQFLSSSSAERLLPLCAALLLFILPFLILTPQKAAQKQEREDKHVSYVLAGEDIQRTASRYILKYHDPKSFLFAPDSIGFGFFRTIEGGDPVQPPPPLPPVFDLPGPRETMQPAPLPCAELAFRTPLTAAILPDASAEQNEAAPAEQSRYPLLTAADGALFPLDDRAEFSASAIRRLSPQSPTVFSVQKPVLPDLPWTALLVSSSGMPHLDNEALRLIDILLLDSAFREKARSGRLTVYWLPPVPAVSSPAEGAAEKEPAS